MTEMRQCPDCGATIEPGVVGGHCASCLLRIGLAVVGWVDAFGESETTPSENHVSKLRHLGDYVLIEEIGRGGMGVVYRARQVSLSRIVALKLIRSGELASESEIARFRAEAEAAANLNHPQIVPIYEVGEYEGRHYFSMKFIEGEVLAARIANRQQPVSDLEAGRLLATLARTVHYAHQRGILHRDLKPGNIILDQEGQPHITDFGLAKRIDADSAMTQSGVIVGTPSYIAPEQAAGAKQLTTAADIYSLGAILYELLAGVPPFVGATAMETLQKVMCEEPRPITSVARDLGVISQKCLEKDPARRYGSSDALADDLERWLRGEPIQARAVTTPERLGKWVRRNPWVAGLSVSLLLAMMFVFLLVVFQLERSKAFASSQAQLRLEAENGINHLELQRAEDYFKMEDLGLALAHLARVLRRDPSNRVAAARLISALTYRDFPTPIADPIKTEGKINWVRFSPDGRQLVTASYDGVARVWDSSSGRPLTAPMRHAQRVRYAEFSPDGLYVVTASGEPAARVWNALNGEPVTPPLLHAKFVNFARFSPDGTRVVSAADDSEAWIWDARNGKRLVGPLTHKGNVLSAHFTPDGQAVLTASPDGNARLWDSRTGELISTIFSHSDGFRSANISPDGKQVILGGYHGAVRLVDRASGRLVREVATLHQLVQCVEFSPDGSRFLAVVGSGVWLWSARDPEQRSVMIRSSSMVTSAQFSPDGTHVVVSALDTPARVWDIGAGAALPQSFDQPGAKVTLFSLDGQRLITAGTNGTLRIWDARTGHALSDPVRTGDSLRTMQPSPDGRWLLTSSDANDGGARIWDARTGRARPNSLFAQHHGGLYAANFSRDSSFVLTASRDGTVRVWRVDTGEAVGEALQHKAQATYACFNPDGRLVATTDAGDKSVRLWEAATGKPVGQIMHHNRDSWGVQFSPDGRWVLSGSEDGVARLWEVPKGGECLRMFRHEARVDVAEFNTNGNFILTASFDKTARVWDAATGQPIGEAMNHLAGVSHAHFSPDSQRVLTASFDHTARLWDVKTGMPLSEPFPHGAPIADIQFSPDGDRIATASYDNKSRIWEVPPVPVPVPDWLPTLAEALGGRRLEGDSNTASQSSALVAAIRERLHSKAVDGFYSQWVTWFLADRATRGRSPFAGGNPK